MKKITNKSKLVFYCVFIFTLNIKNVLAQWSDDFSELPKDQKFLCDSDNKINSIVCLIREDFLLPLIIGMISLTIVYLSSYYFFIFKGNKKKFSGTEKLILMTVTFILYYVIFLIM